MSEMQYRSLPTDNLRAEDDKVTLTGHFSVFNEFYPVYERGKFFLERIAPGSFDETLRTTKPKVLFEHGYDAQIGRKPIGTAKVVHEDARGAYYEAELFHESSYVRDLLPAIRAGEFAASFGFMVEEGGEMWDNHPQRSSYNPEGLPERTITKVRVSEFSVVLDPANPSATAGIRSLTDKYSQRNEVPVEEPTLEDADDSEVVAEAVDGEAKAPEALSESVQVEDAPEGTDETAQVEDSARATDSPIEKEIPNMENHLSVEERAARNDVIQSRLEEISGEYESQVLPAEVQAEWDELVSERSEHIAAIEATEVRRAQVARKVASAPAGSTENVRQAPNVIISDGNIYDTASLRGLEPEARERKAYDSARRILDRTDFVYADTDADENRNHVTKLLNGEYVDKRVLSEKVMRSAHPRYRDAFNAWLNSGGMNVRADMALGADANGGFMVPFDLDPTWILTNDGSVNPLRDVARVEKISGTHLQLVTTAGVTVTRDSEAAPVVEGNATLAGPEYNAGRVSAYLPFSFELDAAASGLQAQLTAALAEAKADEEAVTFVTGSGNGLTGVQGLNQLDALNGGNSVINVSGAAGSLSSDDLYALDNDLAPRHRRNASFLANKTTMNAIRQLGSDSDGGDLWVRLAAGLPPELIGYAIREMSEMESQGDSTTNPFLILGDFKKYLIVDRIGMIVQVDNMVKKAVSSGGGYNIMPSGQRAVVAYWWNGGGFIDANGFRGLVDDGV